MIVTNFLRPTLNRTYLHKFLITIIKRTTTQTVPEHNYQTIRQCYSILQVDPDCRDETVIRKAYLEKVKEYHPDSTFQQSKADLDKFNDVQQAYETLIDVLKTYPNEETQIPTTENEESLKVDIRHTAPQHRTHLEYGGYGVGTPSQRQNAYYKMRAEKAQERVYEYRKDRESIETRQELVERKKRGDIKSTNFIERLVEDLIQESMSKGDFNNIRPSGKPIHERNPHYTDFTTYKMNEILIDNGYTPDWILIEKQIRESIEKSRNNLKRVFKQLGSEHQRENDSNKSYLVNQPNWLSALEKFRADLIMINVDIDKLNLIVPMMWRQQVHYSFDKEVEKIVALDPLTIEVPPTDEELAARHRTEQQNNYQQWCVHQMNQHYSLADAIRDIVQALKNFKL